MLCAWLNLAEEGDEIEVKKVDDEADDKDDEEEEEEDEEEDDEHEDKWERDTTCGMEENPGVFDTGNGALKYYDVNPNYPGIVRVTVESYCGRTDEDDRWYMVESTRREYRTLSEAVED